MVEISSFEGGRGGWLAMAATVVFSGLFRGCVQICPKLQYLSGF
jgi:hypothetical protein